MVRVISDTVHEADETFLVGATSSVNAFSALAEAGQGVGTIVNDDAAPPSPPPPSPPAPPPPAPARRPAATKYALAAPAKNAVVTAPPTLRWTAYKGAKYHNVQVWRVSSAAQTKAVKKGKILSAWPSGPSFRLQKTWKFGNVTNNLTPGRYKWDVWREALGEQVRPGPGRERARPARAARTRVRAAAPSRRRSGR
jgi:hypothetical protein